METQGNQAKAQVTYEWTAQPFSPCKPSGFSPSLLQIFSSMWKPLSNDRSDNNRWDGTFSISAIVVAAIAGEWFPYDRYDPCDSWTFFSQRSQQKYLYYTYRVRRSFFGSTMWSLSELGVKEVKF